MLHRQDITRHVIVCDEGELRKHAPFINVREAHQHAASCMLRCVRIMSRHGDMWVFLPLQAHAMQAYALITRHIGTHADVHVCAVDKLPHARMHDLWCASGHCGPVVHSAELR